MAKFKKGDRVKVKIDGKTYVGKVGGTYGRGDYFVDFDKQLVTSDGVKVGKDWLFNESQLTLANAVTSTNPVVANAIKAANGSYDTLIIRKDPKFGNKWCIFQDGCSNRMVQRVFDTPEWAKKYIKEDLPAWKDAKIRVKNAVAKNAAISDEKELLRLVGTEMNQARAHLGNVIRNAKEGKAGGIKNFYTDHVSDLERIYNELWKF